MLLFLSASLAAVCVAGDPSADGDAVVKEVETVTLKITSPAFEDQAAIPRRHTCEGKDLSPELAWTGTPPGTASFVLILDDPDAPPGTWVHWVVCDIPADARGLPEGVPKKERLEDGTLQGLAWGVDRFSRVGYYGPCPPPGSPHRYFFKLYALDATLGLAPRATKPQVVRAMDGHVLAQAELVGTYRR